MAKAHNYIRGGDTAQKAHKLERGDTAHTFSIGRTILVGKSIYWEGGTPHILCSWVEQFGWGHRTTLRESK